MDKILIFPTWLLAAAFQPLLPKKHVWKYTIPTLGQWAQGATELCFLFSILLWITTLEMAALLLVVLS